MNKEPRRLGKYELQERLGLGGMAEVWKAMDTQLQRYVAIKFLHADLRTDPDFMTRFVREAQAIASLRHPNIVQIHDFQTSTESDANANTAYMVMNYIEGPTLAEYIRDTSRLGKFPPLSNIMYLFSAISSAVDYAHQRGMVHRDIKPSNIMLDQRNVAPPHIGKPILMDFGIVKLLGASSNTLSGLFVGTPHYMSPEQAQGRPGDGRSDIYSLGVILYEICTGVRPFQGDNPSIIMMQHITAMPTPPDLINPNIPAALTHVILCSLSKDPAARFPNAAAMATAMAEALNMSPPVSVSSTPNYKTTDQSHIPPMSAPISLPGGLPSSFMVSPTPQSALSIHDGQYTATNNNVPQSFAATTPVSPQPVTLPPQKLIVKKKRQHLLAIALVLLLLVVLGASWEGFYLFTQRHVPAIVPDSIVGQVYFDSSTPLNEQDSQGIEDELHIDLASIATPASGKSYYAWLLGDKKLTTPTFLFLGKLTVNGGRVSLSYLHDPQHTNLLKHYSQFLITEENATPTPARPALDKHAWAYYAELPQQPDGTLANSTALDQIRTLLVKGPIGKDGTDILFLRSAYQVMTLANNARDAWNRKDAKTLRDLIISILDYIDSASLVQQDVPAGTPLKVDVQFVQIPLLDYSQEQVTASYITRVGNLLNGVLSSPGITPTIHTLATQARNDLPTVQSQLLEVHTDAKLLIQMNNTQLFQAEVDNTLNDLATAASSAYNVVDLSTNEPIGGVFWIHTQIQNLATFEVRKYSV